MSENAPAVPANGQTGFEDLFKNAPFGYLCLSSDLRIVQANLTAARWLGCSLQDLVGMGLHDRLSIGSRMFWETHLGPLLRMQGEFESIALDFTSSDGSKLPTYISASSHRDAHGLVTRIRLALFRATERRNYERSILQARRSAEQDRDQVVEHDLATQESLRREREVSELRDQFIAVLGHDLRNPLAALNSGLRVLASERLSQRGERVTGLMQGAVTRMTGLIDNILDFARGRLGGGIALSQRSQVQVETVVRQVVDEFRTSAPERVIELSIVTPSPVSCDPARLGQIVSNLLGNAITHGDARQPVRVSATQSAQALEISVSNAGPAIPADMMEMLFRPFFRGDVRSSRHGLGLGLYIASEVARAHGGTLSASSTPSETRFTFQMPLASS